MSCSDLPRSHALRITRREAITAGLAACTALLPAGHDSGSARAAPASGSGGAIGGERRDTAVERLPLIEKVIPATGERLPVVGLGTNAFGADGPQELTQREAVLQMLSRLGGKVVDTAAIYGGSEAVIGRSIASLGIRDRIFLATKVMARSRAEGEASIEASFRNLATPRIDLLQVHNLMDLGEMVPRLHELKKAGRIRYVGITAFQPRQHARMLEALARFPLDFIQVDYSIEDRAAAQRVLPLARRRGVAVLVNVPFGGRRGQSVFERVRGRELPAWTRSLDVASWGQLFLKYVVSHPAVTCVIPGTTDVAHLEDNLRAARGHLPDAAERRRIEALWESMA